MTKIWNLKFIKGDSEKKAPHATPLPDLRPSVVLPRGNDY